MIIKNDSHFDNTQSQIKLMQLLLLQGDTELEPYFVNQCQTIIDRYTMATENYLSGKNNSNDRPTQSA